MRCDGRFCIYGCHLRVPGPVPGRGIDHIFPMTSHISGRETARSERHLDMSGMHRLGYLCNWDVEIQIKNHNGLGEEEGEDRQRRALEIPRGLYSPPFS